MIAIQLAFSLVVLFLIIKLLYYKHIPLFLMAGVSFQWLSVSIKVFYAATKGISLREVFSYYSSSDYIDTAFYLSIVGVVTYVVGLKMGLPRYYKSWSIALVRPWIMRMNSSRIILMYLVYSLILVILWRIRFVVPGINTSIFALGLVKWGILTVTVLSAYFKRDKVGLLFFILGIEITLSLVSYFSTFKEYVLILIIIFASLENRLFSPGKMVKYGLAAILLFQVAIVWTTVKGEYRTYLSGGERVQRVDVDRTSALSKLLDLVSNYKNTSFDESIDYFIDRMGYISFFSIAIEHVPQAIPHENGKVWTAALTHVITPRIFFPHKAPVDDSEHLNKYTGLGVAGAEQGASHSIGYMADSYIDFGPYWMFAPIFLLGLVTGYLYRYFLANAYNRVWALILITPFYYLTNINGMNSLKVVSNLIIYFLIAYLINKFIAPRISAYLMRS